MDRTNICYVCVFPAVVIYHRTIWIETPRHPYDALKKGILAWVAFLQSRETHTLINWYPSNNARMVVIAPNCILP